MASAPPNQVSPADRTAKYQPLICVTAGVCAGIAIDRLWPKPLLGWCLGAAVLLVVWREFWRRSHDAWAAAPLLAAVVATSAAWHHCQWDLFRSDDLGLFARFGGEPVCVEAIAVSGPRRVPAPAFDPLRTIPIGERSRLELDLREIRDGDQWRTAGGRATLIVEGHLLGVQAGDRLRVFGQLYAAQPPANPGEFDYAENARADHLLCSVRADFPQCVTRLASGSVWSVSRAIDGLRMSGDALLWRHLDPRRAGLTAAMFLGIREELEAEQSQAFLETGTIHLLVVSGLNVAILAMFVMWGLRLGLVPQRAAIVGVAILAVVYAAVTDAQPPVVRAAVTVLVFCAARGLGRRALSANSLAAAALIVLAINPAELFRAGTQLSFLSVAALAWVGRRQFATRSRDPLDRLITQTRPWMVRTSRRFAAAAWRALVTSEAIWLIVYCHW